MKRVSAFAAMLLLASLTSLFAQDGADTLSLQVYFRQNRYDIDMSYKDNGTALRRFINAINSLQGSSATGVDYIAIRSTASPEGPFAGNESLAMNRAKSIREYLVNHLAISASQLRTYSAGENWEDFFNYVISSTKEENPYRDEVLEVLTRYNMKTSVNYEKSVRCKAELRKIDGGRAWEWLNDKAFPDFRTAAGITCVMKPHAASPAGAAAGGRDTVVIIHEYTGPATASVTEACVDSLAAAVNGIIAERNEAERRRHGFRKDSLFRVPVLALRSNLLVPLTNLGIEIPLGNRWSIETDFYSPWMRREWMNRLLPYYRYCAQVQAAYLCSRVWLGPRHSVKDGDPRYRLRGHSIGFGFGALHYDVGIDYRGQQCDAIAFGVDYKYAQPLGRGGVHLEFTVGVCGYYRTYENYFIDTIYSSDTLLSDGGRRDEIFAAPFKAGISLVVPIFRKEKTGEGR